METAKTTLTTHQRVTRMFDHQEADCNPITASIWSATIAPWQDEGMPQNVSPAEYFGNDRFETIIDISPQYSIEFKDGMDPMEQKWQYGDDLLFHGGINATLWDKKDEIMAEIENLIPVMRKNGWYIFSSDHSVPLSVSLQDFKDIIAKVKQVSVYL
jgi:hypothetical protein